MNMCIYIYLYNFEKLWKLTFLTNNLTHSYDTSDEVCMLHKGVKNKLKCNFFSSYIKNSKTILVIPKETIISANKR